MSYNIQTQKKSSDQQQERLELLKHLIQLYTHHNSSCVPRHVANDMLISITYIAHHATGDASLKKRYVHGLQQLELLCQACKHRLAKVQLYAEWYPNERLHYLLTDFFPTYLKRLSSPYAPLLYAFEKEDIDYPLLDGLPLEHAMYHLQGIDLISHYLEQLSYEVAFLKPFYQDLPMIYKLYQMQRHVSLFELNQNLVEVLLPQVLLHVYLKQSYGVQLDAAALDAFNKRLSIMRPQELLQQMYLSLQPYLDEDVYAYVYAYFPILNQRLQNDMENHAELFIFENNTPKQYTLQVMTACLNSEFTHHQEVLSAMTSTTEKIHYFRTHLHNFQDMIEIWDSYIFSLEELTVLFQSYTPMDFAIFLRHHYAEQFVFTAWVTLDELLLLPASADWEEALHMVLSTLSKKQQHILEQWMNSIKLQY